MNQNASRSGVSKIKSYVIWDDFSLVCRKSLHSNQINTPPLHAHKDFYELVTVASGEGVHQLGSQQWNIRAGNVFLIAPHNFHCYVQYDNLLIYNLLFSKRFLSYFLPDLNRLPGYQLLFNLAAREAGRKPSETIRIKEEFFPEVIQLLDRMDKLNNSVQPGDKTLMLSLFAHVMLLLARHVHLAGTSRRMASVEQLTALLSELEKNFTALWSLERMAKHCNMSVSSFRQSFRELTGAPPLEYLLRLRLTRAARSLEYSSDNLEIIAANCGFNDVNYFSKQFKKHFNILPSYYRRECQSGRRPPILENIGERSG